MEKKIEVGTIVGFFFFFPPDAACHSSAVLFSDGFDPVFTAEVSLVPGSREQLSLYLSGLDRAILAFL